MLDAPLVDNPGMPAPSETETLLTGRLPDVLTRVNRWLGANLDLYSVDEVLLFMGEEYWLACGAKWVRSSSVAS